MFSNVLIALCVVVIDFITDNPSLQNCNRKKISYLLQIYVAQLSLSLRSAFHRHTRSINTYSSMQYIFEAPVAHGNHSIKAMSYLRVGKYSAKAFSELNNSINETSIRGLTKLMLMQDLLVLRLFYPTNFTLLLRPYL